MSKGNLGYTLKDDAESAKDVFIQSSDMWARPMLLDSVSAVLDITTPNAATLTPAVAPSWVSGAYDGKRLVIAGQEVDVDTSSDTAITFDASALVGLVNGATYSYRVMGDAEWLGDSEGKSFDQKDEVLPFKTGIPRKTKFRDLIERTVTIKGKLKMMGSSVMAALLGLADDSITAQPEADPPVVGYTVKTGGSNPSSFNNRFMLIFKSSSRENKLRQLECFYCDFKSDGGIELDSDGHKLIGFTAEVLSDPLRIVEDSITQDNDMYQIKDEV